MPVCPTGYALASFRPCPISHPSLGTAERLELFEKSKAERNSFISAACFPIHLHLGTWRFLPIKIGKRQSMGGKPHTRIKRWALRGTQDCTGRQKAEPMAGTRAMPVTLVAAKQARGIRCCWLLFRSQRDTAPASRRVGWVGGCVTDAARNE